MAATREDEKYVLTGPLPTAAIPTTLHASLVARFDRVGPVKEMAQIGAALGREFSFELMASLTGIAENDLARSLEQLVAAELVHRRGTPPHATYTFKHALVQDAAYGTLLRAKRQELHARIAEVLEAKFPETTETQPEILARHSTEAGLTRPAIDYWRRAGERAAKRSANVEAIAHLKRGLDVIEASPEKAAYAEQELGLLIALGPVLMTTRSSAAPEVSRLYSRARLLAQQIGRSADLYATVWGAWIVAFAEGNLGGAARFVDDLFAIARDEGDSGLVLQAHHAAWPTVMVAGDLLGARGHIEAGLSIYVREKHAHHAHLYGAHDAAVCGHSHQGWVLALLGHLDQAVRQMDQALALARDLRHPPSLLQALWSAAELRYIRREPEVVEELAAAVQPLALQHGSVVAVANARMLRGWALVARGVLADGIAELRKGMDLWRTTGSRYQVPYRLARAADALRASGHAEEAMSVVAEALGMIEKGGERWVEAELHRLKGELQRVSPAASAEAERCFHRALDIARKQSAKLFELRASTSLARLWRDQGRHDDARALLGPAYEWFAEGLGYARSRRRTDADRGAAGVMTRSIADPTYRELAKTKQGGLPLGAARRPRLLWPCDRGGKRRAVPHRQARCFLFLARIVGRIDIGDRERALAMHLNDRRTRCPGVVIHLRRGRGKPAGGQHHAFLGSSLSPMPILNLPEITVTYSEVGWLWAGSCSRRAFSI